MLSPGCDRDLSGCRLVGSALGFARRSILHWNALIGAPLVPGKAHPITPGCVDVSVWRRFDFLALRGDLLETPVAFPAISSPNKGRMRRGGIGYAQPARTAITRPASPLSIEELEGAPTRHVIRVGDAKPRDLSEIGVAGPALFTRAVMRIRGDVAMRLLRVARAHPRDCAGEDHIRRGHCSFFYFDTHTVYGAAFSPILPHSDPIRCLGS